MAELVLSIELRIEHLVLDGFASADRASIADAVESELAGLLGELDSRSAIQNSSELERVNGGTISLKLAAREPPPSAGQIAQAVHRSFVNGQSENLQATRQPNSAIPAKR